MLQVPQTVDRLPSRPSNCTWKKTESPLPGLQCILIRPTLSPSQLLPCTHQTADSPAFFLFLSLPSLGFTSRDFCICWISCLEPHLPIFPLLVIQGSAWGHLLWEALGDNPSLSGDPGLSVLASVTALSSFVFLTMHIDTISKIMSLFST